MRNVWKRLTLLAIVATLVLAASAALAKKGPPPPPPCGCAVKIVFPDGTVCTLVSCGSDCVYVCTTP